MLALGGASRSSLHLPLSSTQIYIARPHVDFTAGTPPAGKLRWICPGVRLGKERGREGSRTCSNSWTEGQRSGRQLGDLPDKALKAIGKSRPV